MHTTIRTRALAMTIGLPVVLSITSVGAQTRPPGKPEIERGRYVVVLGGCNDCHTEGYAPKAGKVPEADWLKGSALGFRGAWGTTYPSNLRLYLARLTADQWVVQARTLQTRPPMPWFTLHDMTEADLRAMHAFVRSLPGPPGDPAPAFLPPGQMPQGPAVVYP